MNNYQYCAIHNETGKIIYASSERELARKLGVHHKNIYDILHGSRKSTANHSVGRSYPYQVTRTRRAA